MRIVTEVWKELNPSSNINYISLDKMIEEYKDRKSGNIRFTHPQGYVDLLYYTNFLDNPTIRQRFWHITNRKLEKIKCPECNSDYLHWLEGKLSYKEYCNVCYKKLHISFNKKENSMLEKYGEKSIDYLKNKMKDQYGVDNYFSTDKFSEERKQVCQDKYGTDYFIQSEEFKRKYKETIKEKYGVDHYSQSSEFKDKFKNTCLEKYNCHPNQIKYPKEIIQKTNDKEWLTHQHHVLKKTIAHISKELLGFDKTTLSTRFKNLDIQIKSFENSQAEREIKQVLESNNVEFELNNRKIIAPLEIDVFIPKLKLAIEYCGLYWHSDIKKSNNYHKMKYDLCKTKGIRLLTIFEDEWLEKEDLIKEKIIHIIGKSKQFKVFARKCKIMQINTKQKREFFNKFHIQGDGPSSINYGLEYNNEIIAVIGFIKNQDNSFTLNRYATKYNVVGGFTKLLKHFEEQFNFPKIITFADLRWSEGELYYNSGFCLDKVLKPDYYWAQQQRRYHKFNFRHKQMKNKLKNYESALSEAENMHNHGYYKIFDCGKLRFIKN